MHDLDSVVAQTTPGLPFEPPTVEPLLGRAGWFLVGFLTVVVLGRYVLVPSIDRVVRARNRDNPTLREAIIRYLRVLVVVVALFVGLAGAGFGQLLGNSAIIFAAVTLALGVAGQAVIGSLVSGLALVVDPQFNVGNYIRWADGEGEVRSITLRVTRVQTPDGALVTIPNTTLTDEAIVRPFESKRARVVEQVGIAYEDDVDAALSVLTETASSVEDVLAEPAPTAGIEDLGGDGVILSVQFWVRDPRQNRFEVRQAFARQVKRALDEAGIGINPPTKRDLQGQIEVAETVAEG